MKYDATLKRLFLSPPVKLLEMLLGQEVAVERLLPTEMITVDNMHPDLLFQAPDLRLIHLEVHGYGMPDFAVRNLLYFGFVLRDYKRAPEQLVVWIGKDKPGVPDGLDYPPHLTYHYPVFDARTLDAEPLLAAPGVEEAIFAVLCRSEDKRATVLRILRRIVKLPVAEQREALIQLLILSGLRGLTPLVQTEVQRMPIAIDIHENEFLEGIYQDGKNEGRSEGRSEGLEQGRLRAAREVLLDLMEQKFGAVPAAVELRVGKADWSDTQHWSRRVLQAASIDEVFQ